MGEAHLNETIERIERAVAEFREKAVHGARENAERAVQARSLLKGLAHELVAQGEGADSLVGVLTQELLTLKDQAQAPAEIPAEFLARLSAAESEAAEKSHAITTANDRIRELEDAVSRAESSRETIGNLERTLSEKDAALQAAQQRVSKLEHQLTDTESVTRSHEEHVNTLERDIAALRSAIEEAKSRETQLEKRCAELSDSNQATAQRAAQIEREAGEARSAQQQAEARAQSAEAKLLENGDGVTVLQRELDGLKDTERSLLQQIEQHQVADASAALELKRLRDELDAANAALQDKDLKLAERNSAESEVKSNAERLESELKNLREELARVRLQADKGFEVRKLYQAEKERADALEQRLRGETAKGTKSALAEQLADALKELEDSNNEVIRLKTKFESMQRERVGSDADSPDESESTQHMVGRDRDGRRRQIGEILVDAGTISQEQLEETLEEQRRSPQRHIGEILIENQYASEDSVAQALAVQCSLPFVRIKPESIDRASAALISKRLATQRRCVPISSTGESIVVAMFNPLDLIAIEDVERATSRRVDPVVATYNDIMGALGAVY